MSLEGLQNFTQPLSLLGFTTIEKNLNARNVFVNGTLSGDGISNNILSTNNTWTGTNNYANVTIYSGPSTGSALPNELTTKADADFLVVTYNPASGAMVNFWNGLATFNGNVSVPNSAITDDKLISATQCNNFVNNYQTIPDSVSNKFTGNNQFNNNIQVSNIPSLLVPTLDNQLASKVYVDAKIEVAGKTLTYTILTPGTYNFDFINRPEIIGIEFMLFGGSVNNSHSGAMYSGKIGNGNGNFSSLFLQVGVKDNVTNYSSTLPINSPQNTYLLSGSEYVGIAGGAYILNQQPQPGLIYGFNSGLTATSASIGKALAPNLFAYSNILGTTNANGGAIFVAYFR
jgi:hypothetical protein